MTLKALGLNCTLSASPKPSSSQKLLDQLLDGLKKYDVETESVRVVDLNIKPGVSHDEGEGDEWPALRQRIMAADILVIATPIWMGQPSSVSKRVLERMDAILGDIGDDGRYPTFGKVGLVGVVGNEDGAHHVTAEIYQALADVGFTIPAGSSAYWVGEAMSDTNYIDLKKTPEKVAKTIATLTTNAAHLATLLQASNYPAP
ncbi:MULTISPECIES: NAD(P)H-dependent oxidoreductase [Rhodanobacteraceae]|uniref:flavodoxin family protein n=1 Tax=Rhodanobacteraceae TaxID=1775411 RepID=UPI000882CD91|nr:MULTISPECIES: NAD(P)H-dependent oxidoreductase [Rhodanobacteraceae]SDF63730.1 Multimeric flavodoxin WrbA [Dyella sp. 333MFSha]SKB61689.1 Multimeric flavodoxin WrbA [Luteibacter sp. 22Crub2.1]